MHPKSRTGQNMIRTRARTEVLLALLSGNLRGKKHLAHGTYVAGRHLYSSHSRRIFLRFCVLSQN